MGMRGIRVAAAGAVVLLSAGWLGTAAGPAARAQAPDGEVPAAGPSHHVTPAPETTGKPDRAARSSSQSPSPALFDPARHMRVSEVRAGMKGYGLSVFKGT